MVPTIDADENFALAAHSWLAGDPYEILIITEHSVLPALQALADRVNAEDARLHPGEWLGGDGKGRVKVLSVERANKRLQMAKGIKAVTTDIIVSLAPIRRRMEADRVGRYSPTMMRSGLRLCSPSSSLVSKTNKWVASGRPKSSNLSATNSHYGKYSLRSASRSAISRSQRVLTSTEGSPASPVEQQRTVPSSSRTHPSSMDSPTTSGWASTTSTRATTSSSRAGWSRTAGTRTCSAARAPSSRVL